MRSKTSPGGQQARTFIEEARRAQIIGAAIGTIAEVGYSQASLARIAARASISKGVISYHFAGKDELMDQVVVQVYTAVAEFVTERVTLQPDARSGLRAYVLAVAEYMHGHREQLLALSGIFTGARTPKGEPRYGVAAAETTYQALEELLRRGQESGEFRGFDRRVLAVSMQASIDAMFGYWVAFPEHDLQAHAVELAELLDRATRAE